MLFKTEVDKILDKFRNLEGSNEDSYFEHIEENGKEISLEDTIYDYLKDEAYSQYEFTYIGGFDSPGYSIRCYCLSYIDLEGYLTTRAVNFEEF